MGSSLSFHLRSQAIVPAQQTTVMENYRSHLNEVNKEIARRKEEHKKTVESPKNQQVACRALCEALQKELKQIDVSQVQEVVAWQDEYEVRRIFGHHEVGFKFDGSVCPCLGELKGELQRRTYLVEGMKSSDLVAVFPSSQFK